MSERVDKYRNRVNFIKYYYYYYVLVYCMGARLGSYFFLLNYTKNKWNQNLNKACFGLWNPQKWNAQKMSLFSMVYYDKQKSYIWNIWFVCFSLNMYHLIISLTLAITRMQICMWIHAHKESFVILCTNIHKEYWTTHRPCLCAFFVFIFMDCFFFSCWYCYCWWLLFLFCHPVTYFSAMNFLQQQHKMYRYIHDASAMVAVCCKCTIASPLTTKLPVLHF